MLLPTLDGFRLARFWFFDLKTEKIWCVSLHQATQSVMAQNAFTKGMTEGPSNLDLRLSLF